MLTKITAQESKLNLGGGLGVTSADAIGGIAISIESNYLFKISENIKLGTIYYVTSLFWWS